MGQTTAEDRPQNEGAVEGAVPDSTELIPAELPATPLRVLVVDDNRDAADSVAALLQAMGHQVDVASSADEALLCARHGKPDVAFFDLGMPGMDGCALALEFRREPRLSDVGLIALTGWAGPTDRGRTREVGFDAHLMKPAALETLEAALRDVLSSRNATPPT